MSIWFTPNDLMKRRSKSWGGIEATTFQASRLAAIEYGHKSTRHVLMVAERAVREDGETSIAGIESSTLHDYSGRLTFVPAGHEFKGWQRPRELLRSMMITFDSDSPLIDPELGFREIEFQPRLFFFDEMLWTAAQALKKQVENVSGHPESYGEALVAVLAHRLVQLHGAESEQSAAGIGLAPRHRTLLTDFIDAHLHEQIPLATLAKLVRLSPFHFARLFKQSFGEPPHRYVTRQRIERAKRMLAQGDRSVAEIGFEVGFGESSSFTAAFRKMTGTTPARFRRQQD
jgi:AraC family transcriptional regulator